MSHLPVMPHILLIEPQFVLRRTIVALARNFSIGQLQEASSAEAAVPLLSSKRFGGVVLDLGGGSATFDLLARLRHAEFVSDATIPVVGMTSDPRSSLEVKIESFGLLRLLTKPFKVGELLQVMQQMTSSRG